MKVFYYKDVTRDWRSYIAEFFGTFFFVLISSMAVVVDSLYGGLGIVGVSLAIGFSYSAIVFGTVNLSGGYLNPSITVALWLARKLSSIKTVIFLVMQILASFLAALFVLTVFGMNALELGLGSPILGIDVSLSQAVFVEAIFTAGLVFAVFTTMVDRQGPVSFGPLVLGFYVVAVTLILLPISGAGINPARALGGLILSGQTNSLAVWFIGPLSGSLLAIFYEVIFLRKKKR